MNKKVQRQCCDYEYTCEDEEWSVTTDYVNGNIYLNAPANDDDIQAIKRFGIAIGRAVADMKKAIK